MERHATIANISRIGWPFVVPRPERNDPDLAPMVRGNEVKKRPIEVAIGFEEARNWVDEDVHEDNKFTALNSGRPDPEDSENWIEVRCVEVKYADPLALRHTCGS